MELLPKTYLVFVRPVVFVTGGGYAAYNGIIKTDSANGSKPLTTLNAECELPIEATAVSSYAGTRDGVPVSLPTFKYDKPNGSTFGYFYLGKPVTIDLIVDSATGTWYHAYQAAVGTVPASEGWLQAIHITNLAITSASSSTYSDCSPTKITQEGHFTRDVWMLHDAYTSFSLMRDSLKDLLAYYGTDNIKCAQYINVDYQVLPIK